MKRIFAMLLALMMVFGLVACGTTEAEVPATEVVETTVTEAPEVEETTEAPVVEETTEAPVVEETTEAPVVEEATETTTVIEETTAAPVG